VVLVLERGEGGEAPAESHPEGEAERVRVGEGPRSEEASQEPEEEGAQDVDDERPAWIIPPTDRPRMNRAFPPTKEPKPTSR
jgi:hypothetical protein